MIKRYFFWDKWREAYWDGIGDHPEWFAFLHRMYVLQMNLENAHPGLRRSAFPKEKNLAVKTVCCSENLSDSAEHTDTMPAESGVAGCDVVFFAYARRATCLGVGEKLFQRMSERLPGLRCVYYQNSRNIIIEQPKHKGVPVVTLHPRITLSVILRFISGVPRVFLCGLFSNATVRLFMTRHPLRAALGYLRTMITTVAVEDMLQHLRPRVVIAPNEQGGGDSSVFFALCKKQGIKTVQYLHGAPTKQFTPFISDEFWVWGELSKQMLLRGTEDQRVVMVGSLEHEVDGCASVEERSAGSDCAGIRVLFLAQAGMDEGWGIQSFKNGVDLLKKGLSAFPQKISLRVREHPSADARRRGVLEEAFCDIDYEVTTKETPLAEDVAWATHVYSVSSNAILAGLLGGKPSYLLWNDELDEIYGRCFLPDENKVTDESGLMGSLKTFDCPISPSQSIEELLGPPGALDRAADRIAALTGTC